MLTRNQYNRLLEKFGQVNIDAKDKDPKTGKKRFGLRDITNTAESRAKKRAACEPAVPNIEITEDLKNLMIHCGQTAITPMQSILKNRCITKIGEGSFAEVYAMKDEKDPDSRLTVLKVMPVGGDTLLNDYLPTSYADATAEVAIYQSFKNLDCPNFIVCTRCVLCYGEQRRRSSGSYPQKLLEAFDEYKALYGDGAETQRPDVFPKEQVYLVFLMEDGGTDLSSYTFPSAIQSICILKQLCLALAMSEDKLNFEHRDLHWGNVLVVSTEDREFRYEVQDQQFVVSSHGLKVNIIDFTFAFISTKRNRKEMKYFHEPDEEIFDLTGEVHFDVYRKMLCATGGDWENFHPVTNLLWIDYLIQKLVDYKDYRGRSQDTLKAELTGLRKRLKKYESTVDLVLHDPFFQEECLIESD